MEKMGRVLIVSMGQAVLSTIIRQIPIGAVLSRLTSVSVKALQYIQTKINPNSVINYYYQ